MYSLRSSLSLAVLATLVSVSLLSQPAHAELVGHLWLGDIWDIGSVNTTDADDDPSEGVSPEPFWRIAIFDENPTSEIDPSLYSVETDFLCSEWTQTTTLGVQQEFTRILPDQTEAYFLIGVYDWDIYWTNGTIGSYYAELIGDHHWQGERTARDDPYTSTGGESNVNEACCYFWRDPDNPGGFAPICGSDDPIGFGFVNNFRVTFDSWFEDTTDPAAASGLVHSDGTAPTGYNDDNQIVFSWTPGSDPNTGTRQLIRLVRGSDSASCQVWLGSATETQFQFQGTISCDAGGTLAQLTLTEGESYTAQIQTRNGVTPALRTEHVGWANSNVSPPVVQDSAPATTTVDSPAAGSWHSTDFVVTFTDSGNAVTCEYRVNTGEWLTRGCDGSVTIDVGVGGDCNTPGADECVVQGRATSGGGSVGTGSRTFSVDWISEPLPAGSLLAWQSSAQETAIAGAVWQQDGTPYFSWSDPTSAAPALEYERGFATEEPDCGVLTASTSLSFDQSVSLLDGRHLFWVRVIDTAGNCSEATGFDLRLDTTGDSLGGVTALPFNGAPEEDALPESTWQRDNTPHLRWTGITGTNAPVDEYAVGWGTDPADCSSVQTGTSVTVSAGDPRPDGVNVFNVRALDQAGNCGPPSSFSLYVDVAEDDIDSLVLRDEGGLTITPGQWQTEALPMVEWSATSSAGTDLAYSLRVTSPPGGAADCTPDADAVSPFTPDTPFPDGRHRFSVRAIDLAGNCGVAQAADLWVDRHAESIIGLDSSDVAVGLTASSQPTFTWGTDRVAANESASRFSVDVSPGAGVDPSCSAAQTDTSYTPPTALADGDWTISVRGYDEALNCGPVSRFTFTVDTQAPQLAGVDAFADASLESPITSGAWQQDRDPVVTWSLTIADPSVTYSVGVDVAADCIADQAEAEIAVAAGALSDGQHRVEVAPIDAAGNCGTALGIDIWVDATGDGIVSLGAYSSDPDSGGTSLPPSAPQPDADPFFSWSTNTPGGTSSAPVSGYFFGLNEPADCDPLGAPDSNSPEYAVTVPLDDGTYTFAVAALDASGNCGAPSTFVLEVLASAPFVSFQSATPSPARADVDVTIRFSVDRVLDGLPSVTVDGSIAANYLSVDEGVYVYRYHTLGSETEGAVDIDIDIVDEAGNPGTGFGQVTFDFTRPTLTALTAAPAVIGVGDRASLSVTTSEALASAPVVTVNGVEALAEAPVLDGDVWTSVYEAAGTEAEGAAEVAVQATDLAGNTRNSTGRLDFDFTTPVVALMYPAYRELLNIGEAVTIEWETVDVNPGTVTIELSRAGLDAFDTILAESIPDTGSFDWVVTGPATTAARIRVTATDQVGLQGADSGVFDFRIRELAADHLILTADQSVASVGSSVSITAQVVDSLGDVVGLPVAISLELDGSAEVVSSTLADEVIDGPVVSGTTDDNGLATIVITDRVAETITASGFGAFPEEVPSRDAVVTFEPSGADHLVAFVDDGVAPLGGLEAILVQVVDVEGNPVATVVEVSVSVDGDAQIVTSDVADASELPSNELTGRTGADGIAELSIRSFTAETVNVLPDSASDLLTLEAPHEGTSVMFLDEGAIDPFQSRIIVDPNVVFADGLATADIVVEPRNGAGELVGTELSVAILTTQGTLDDVTDEGDGTYTSAVSSALCRDEAAIISAEVEGIALLPTGEVRFTCEAVADAVLTAEPARIPGDGERCSVLSATPLSPSGDSMSPGQAVQFRPSLGKVEDLVEAEGGVYLADFCSSECDPLNPAVIEVSVNGVRLSDLDEDLRLEVQVDCLAIDTEESTITATPAELLADGEEVATVVVTPIDNFGDPMGAGLEVTVLSSVGELTEVEDLEDGTYRSLLTSTQPGTAQITASVNGLALAAEAAVLFNPATTAYPGAQAITVAQELLGGELEPGGNATIRAVVRSTLSYDLTDVYLALVLDPGLALKADSLLVDGDAVTATADGSRLVIALGDIPARMGASGSEPLEIRYELRFDEAAAGTLIASLQAFVASDERPISEDARLSLDVDELADSLPGAEACACRSLSLDDPYDALWPALAILLVAIPRQRKRRRT